MTSDSNMVMSSATDDEISLNQILSSLRLHLRLIISISLIGAGIAAGISLIMSPTYSAEVVLTVVEEESHSPISGLASQFGGIASMAGVSLTASSSRAEALGVLNSHALISKYIVKNNLSPVLFYKKWDASNNRWKTGLKKEPSLWDATEFFIDKIRIITDDKKSGLTTLKIEWRDAAQASQWANEIVDLANKTLRDRSIAKSERNLFYLNAQLEKSSIVELRQSIYRLIEAEVKNVMIAQGSDEFAFKVIDPAIPAEKKFKPKRVLITLAGLFLGFLLAVFYALLRGVDSTLD